MKYFFIAILFFSGQLMAQKNLPSVQEKEMIQKIQKTKAEIDSSQEALNRVMEESKKRSDSIEMQRFNEQNNRNLDAFMQSQRVAEKKSKERMWWRLGLGIVFLLLGIYGVMRKRK